MRASYVEVRIAQLKEELDKPNSDYDRAWYNRLIQELTWVQQMDTGTLTHNCFIERGNKNNS